MHDRPVGCGRVERPDVLLDRPAGDGQGVAVQEAALEELAQHDGHATDAVEVMHDVTTGGLGVRDVRHTARDAVEIVDREVDARLRRDREQVQHGIRRAADRADHTDGVLERLARDDVARGDPTLEQADDRLAALACVVIAPRIGCGR